MAFFLYILSKEEEGTKSSLGFEIVAWLYSIRYLLGGCDHEVETVHDTGSVDGDRRGEGLHS